MTDDTKSNSSPTQIRFKVAKSYGRAQVQRRKTIQNFYEFQKKCLELSAEYYQGIANLLEETDVSLFLAPPTPGADPLNIINESGMVMSGMLGPGYVVNDRFIGGKLLKKRVYGEDVEVNDNNSEEAYYSENQKAKHRRAPRQLWSDEEVERLKAAHDRYNGDWELIIKEFEPERTRIQIFQKARQMGLRAVESGKIIDLSKPNTIIEYNNNNINNNNSSSSSNINNNEDGSRIDNEGEEDEEIEETINFENSRIEIKNEKNYTDPKENNKKNEG